MPQPPLPVPPLQSSLDRALHATAAVAAEEHCAEAASQARSFLAGEGPRLQEELEDFALTEHEAGRSWLSSLWQSGYLESRAPLPLTSNVLFQLALPLPGSPAAGEEDMGHESPPAGTDDPAAGAAQVIAAMAAVHLAQARGETPQVVDARGSELCMQQWLALNGGVREPGEGEDRFLACELDGREREIGVFRHGRLFAVTVSGADAEPLPAAQIAAQLHSILSRTSTDTDPTRQMGFADMSYLGSTELAGLHARLCASGENARTYAQLRDMLFTVTLMGGIDGTSLGEDSDPALPSRLHTALAGIGQVWARKPLSYLMELDTGRVHAHVEHTVFDGGSLVDVVARMQQSEEHTLPEAAPAGAAPDGSQPGELRWQLEDDLGGGLQEALRGYRARADELRIDVLRLPLTPAASLPYRMSADALQQLIMTTAQLLTYGRVRGTYESVDMRAFRAGRTECLRPVTPEAVAFARGLSQGEPDAALLDPALDAHRVWVKAAKGGQAFDRHLSGLAMMAERDGADVPFLRSPALAEARDEFLSTTSLGTPAQVVRYAFAPTRGDGFGIAYTLREDCYEFCVTHHAGSDRPAEFVENLGRAAALLHGFLHELSA